MLVWLGYWCFLFVIMHTPVVGTGGLRFDFADKIVHFLLYGTLTLIGAWRAGGATLLGWAVVYAAYGALDEYLQQFVGRSTSFSDWLANIAGITAATIAAALWRRRLSEPPPPV